MLESIWRRRARWAWLGSTVLAAVNALAILLGSRYAYQRFYFASLPGILAGMGSDSETSPWPAWPCYAAALALLGFFVLCWALSKGRGVWLKATFGCCFCTSVAALFFYTLFAVTGAPLHWTVLLVAAAHAIPLVLLTIALYKK